MSRHTRYERKRKCAKCNITATEDGNLSFHRFPLPGRHTFLKARVWAEYCYPTGEWSTEKSLRDLHWQHKMLCSKHFDDSSFTNSARIRLHNFAIPIGTQDLMVKIRQEQCTTASESKQDTSISVEKPQMLELEPSLPVQVPTIANPTTSLPVQMPTICEPTTDSLKKMNFNKHGSDAVHWYMHDLACRVVAKSGIATDNYHAGKLILQSLKEAPNLILQIDGATGESETFQYALERSVRCATAFRNIGLKLNDVIIIMAPLNINLTTSMYAAFYMGIGVAGVDHLLGVKELKDTIQICLPKMIFCQSEKMAVVGEALKHLKFDVTVVTYDKGDTHCSFSEFLQKYGDNTPVDDFQPANIDPEEAISVLLATSGTTGMPKYAAITHKNLVLASPYPWIRFREFPTPIRMALVVSPVQWVSTINTLVMSPILKFSRVQTSRPVTTEHSHYLINKYKPEFVVISPSMMTSLVKPGQREKCDFTCFRLFIIGGSAVPQKLIDDVKTVAPFADVCTGYGMSELGTIALDPVSFIPGCTGRPLGHSDYRLVDPGTGKDVLEPHKTGELWFKGPITFKGYYNNPEMTAEIYTEDKWLKSGDLFYRDENWNFFFADRMKLLLKYKNHQISPTEIEEVIRTHPGVYDVAVTGIPDDECSELPVACVVPQENHTLTAQEIKDLVKSSLTDSKQLRGGVIFMKELPLTSASKPNRTALKSMVKNMKRE